ncbi:hypothetical protein [Sphingomonas oligophenolica]|uniref:hypothetical protein n=1 Tax=Sphingomonas oligophenolica TaxID=301154 RepID=UPI00112A059F|nr:hypothetical protein [Sphingomonas oligophenolica]
MSAMASRLATLPCRLGFHKPVAPGMWNGGYCFTTCSRCGRDMVRSLFGEWHVPVDFRVVWHARPSEPLAERAAPPPPAMPQSAAPVSARVVAPPMPARPPVSAPSRKAKMDKPEPRSPFDFDDFG